MRIGCSAGRCATRAIIDAPSAAASGGVVHWAMGRRRRGARCFDPVVAAFDQHDDNVTLRDVLVATLVLFQPEFPGRLRDARSACGALSRFALTMFPGAR